MCTFEYLCRYSWIRSVTSWSLQSCDMTITVYGYLHAHIIIILTCSISSHLIKLSNTFDKYSARPHAGIRTGITGCRSLCCARISWATFILVFILFIIRIVHIIIINRTRTTMIRLDLRITLNNYGKLGRFRRRRWSNCGCTGSVSKYSEIFSFVDMMTIMKMETFWYTRTHITGWIVGKLGRWGRR